MINEKLRKEGDVAKKTQLAKIALLEEKIKSYGNRVAEQIQYIGNQGNIVEFKGERYFLGLPKSDTRIKSLEFQVEQVLKEVDSKEDFIRTEFRRSMGDLYAENTIVGEQLLDSIVELHFRLNALVRNMDLITVNRPEVDTDDTSLKISHFYIYQTIRIMVLVKKVLHLMVRSIQYQKMALMQLVPILMTL